MRSRPRLAGHTASLPTGTHTRVAAESTTKPHQVHWLWRGKLQAPCLAPDPIPLPPALAHAAHRVPHCASNSNLVVAPKFKRWRQAVGGRKRGDRQWGRGERCSAGIACTTLV